MARFPVNKPYRITQKFSTNHEGIDIAPGTPGQTGVKIYAPESSTVVASGSNPRLEGQYLILKGRNHWYYFGHFAKRSVKLNESVKQGQVIGIMGQTGLATGVHTHHEVRTTRTGGQIDPEKFYKPATINIMKPTKKEVQDRFKNHLGTIPTAKQIAHYISKDSRTLYKDILNVGIKTDKPTVSEIRKLFKTHLGKEPNDKQLEHYLSRDRRVVLNDILKAKPISDSGLKEKIINFIKGA